MKESRTFELDRDKAYASAKYLHSFFSVTDSVGNTPNWVRVANAFTNIAIY